LLADVKPHGKVLPHPAASASLYHIHPHSAYQALNLHRAIET
jgi:hypothetical protein